MIGELALALANGMGKEELERVIRPHPTVEESIGEAVLASEGRRFIPFDGLKQKGA